MEGCSSGGTLIAVIKTLFRTCAGNVNTFAEAILLSGNAESTIRL